NTFECRGCFFFFTHPPMPPPPPWGAPHPTTPPPPPRAALAVGCMAERYGKELADALPEADGVLGFDDYADISDRLQTILSGGSHAAHTPRDRRKLLPLSPVERQAATDVALPGHGAPADLPAGLAPESGPRAPLRRRLGSSPVASVKLASGCDRRCTFCAIPSFRGSFISRRPADVLGETRWLAEQGVKEIMLVSENNTSYGKDLGDIRLLETLLPELAAVDGIERVRVSYLQPAEMRPGLIDVLTGTPKVAPYFDLSFQHSAPGVLRAMRRFGDTDRFLELLETIRARAPRAGVRSNFIVGFPGETAADYAELERFLTHARLDAIGVFGYSDEDGTEAATYENKLDEDLVAERLARLSRLAEELTAQRADERLGEELEVLVESVAAADGTAEPGEAAVGRAAHQAPETDGQVVFASADGLEPGRMVRAKVVATEGVDLVAEFTGLPVSPGAAEVTAAAPSATGAAALEALVAGAAPLGARRLAGGGGRPAVGEEADR
ncbi:MiaB/RimO family radical SAM methylthiotransferase, partial [Streptomyces sp. NPDC058953]|uniref:MiaB/RimO family radical SAM methylthiotransferase n=1 Tax=Streptomyces sp. NPDC058953 TaxID=3346676 RepID=UPI0036A20214